MTAQGVRFVLLPSPRDPDRRGEFTHLLELEKELTRAKALATHRVNYELGALEAVLALEDGKNRGADTERRTATARDAQKAQFFQELLHQVVASEAVARQRSQDVTRFPTIVVVWTLEAGFAVRDFRASVVSPSAAVSSSSLSRRRRRDSTGDAAFPEGDFIVWGAPMLRFMLKQSLLHALKQRVPGGPNVLDRELLFSCALIKCAVCFSQYDNNREAERARQEHLQHCIRAHGGTVEVEVSARFSNPAFFFCLAHPKVAPPQTNKPTKTANFLAAQVDDARRPRGRAEDSLEEGPGGPRCEHPRRVGEVGRGLWPWRAHQGRTV
jgi:hypothetical protein